MQARTAKLEKQLAAAEKANRELHRSQKKTKEESSILRIQIKNMDKEREENRRLHTRLRDANRQTDDFEMAKELVICYQAAAYGHQAFADMVSKRSAHLIEQLQQRDPITDAQTILLMDMVNEDSSPKLA